MNIIFIKKTDITVLCISHPLTQIRLTILVLISNIEFVISLFALSIKCVAKEKQSHCSLIFMGTWDLPKRVDFWLKHDLFAIKTNSGLIILLLLPYINTWQPCEFNVMNVDRMSIKYQPLLETRALSVVELFVKGCSLYPAIMLSMRDWISVSLIKSILFRLLDIIALFVRRSEIIFGWCSLIPFTLFNSITQKWNVRNSL